MKKTTLLGAHLSTAGGLHTAFERAEELGCTAMQIFTHSNRQWAVPVLSHEEALRFSFLLSTPIIGAAALLKLPGLLHSGNAAAIQNALIGGICAAFTAFASIKILTRYFKTRTLTPFAIYCIAVGLLSLIVLG